MEEIEIRKIIEDCDGHVDVFIPKIISVIDQLEAKNKELANGNIDLNIELDLTRAENKELKEKLERVEESEIKNCVITRRDGKMYYYINGKEVTLEKWDKRFNN